MVAMVLNRYVGLSEMWMRLCSTRFHLFFPLSGPFLGISSAWHVRIKSPLYGFVFFSTAPPKKKEEERKSFLLMSFHGTQNILSPPFKGGTRRFDAADPFLASAHQASLSPGSAELSPVLRSLNPWF